MGKILKWLRLWLIHLIKSAENTVHDWVQITDNIELLLKLLNLWYFLSEILDPLIIFLVNIGAHPYVLSDFSHLLVNLLCNIFSFGSVSLLDSLFCFLLVFVNFIQNQLSFHSEELTHGLVRGCSLFFRFR